MECVLQTIENGRLILDFSGFGGVCLLLTTLEVGVHFASVWGVLLVMCDLEESKSTQVSHGPIGTSVYNHPASN